jgi:hypothetical protein
MHEVALRCPVGFQIDLNKTFFRLPLAIEYLKRLFHFSTVFEEVPVVEVSQEAHQESRHGQGESSKYPNGY